MFSLSVYSVSAEERGGEETIKIGGIYDLTGELALIGIQKYQAAQLAVKEINESGGLLGKQVELIATDGQSDITRTQEMAKKLIYEDEVVALHACIYSSCREAIRPLCEKEKILFFYNQQYEGGVASRYFVCVGAQPEQQVIPLLKLMFEKYGPNYYVLSADDSFGQGNAKWAAYAAELYGGNRVGEESIPYDVTQFSSTIDKIRQADPDFLWVNLGGSTPGIFVNQLSASGYTLPMASANMIMHAYEHKRFDPPVLKDLYVMCPYLEELDTPEAKKFTESLYEMFPDAEYYGMEAEAEYRGINFWAEAVRRAGTTDTDALLEEIDKGITLTGMPCGDATLCPESHHCQMDFRLWHVDENHVISVEDTVQQVRPSFLIDDMGIDLRVESPNKQYSIDDYKKA